MNFIFFHRLFLIVSLSSILGSGKGFGWDLGTGVGSVLAQPPNSDFWNKWGLWAPGIHREPGLAACAARPSPDGR